MCTDHLKAWNILTEFIPNSLTRKRIHCLDFEELNEIKMYIQ